MVKKMDNGMELHQLILKRDDLALSKLYDLYGENVVSKLKGLYSKVARTDEVMIYEAVNEAFLGYFRNPLTFDPSKNTLLRFLEIAAERDLINILDKEKKHLVIKKVPQDVELEEKFWNSLIKECQTTDGELIFDETMTLVDKELSNHFNNEIDIRLAKLIISGERDTEVFSMVLKIKELGTIEQRVEVKRNKDRIKKILERNRIIEKLKKLLQ